jgi:uncharacterized protein YyaL (SSP411 family)
VLASREASANSVVPLLEARTTINDRAAAFVCEGFACELPVTEVEQLLELLGRK